MRIFHCDHCHQPVFFENTVCGKCGHKLAYLPDVQIVASLDPATGRSSEVGGPPPALWTTPASRSHGRTYRVCENYLKYNVCNWALPADEPGDLCKSCRLTRIIPDLSRPENREKWCRLEVAKRRLVYSLVEFRLPISNKADDPESGLEFHFLADSEGQPRVLTGHENGVITMNSAEADDVERERARVSMHEPYRTLLGHFRHEIGHYYWDLLIKKSRRLDSFREQFGNEQNEYNQLLQTYYRQGPRPDWQQHFVSAYASVHAWEDWAETWAHYLHMTDALETSRVCGLSLQPDRIDEPSMKTRSVKPSQDLSFREIIDNWFPLTYVLNSLNRSMGLADAYPFVLGPNTVEKLRFVHETICGCRDGNGQFDSSRIPAVASRE
jgi:hypothetical protein